MVRKGQLGGYPGHWEADVVLRDGGTAHIRPIEASDAEAVQRFHQAQSQTSIYLRFFSYKAKLSSKELKRFTTVDYRDRVALVITVGDELLGIARYDRLEDKNEAEVAFNISDRHQGRGLGSILLEHLAAAALENGVRRFSAEVLPENRKMLSVFAEAGYEIRRQLEDGVIMVDFDIDPTARSRSVMESREHRAESQSVRDLLAPSAIAVIGASRHWGKIGNELITHIVEGGFAGVVYAVNPDALEVAGSMAYGSITEVPGKVDLAVIAVPYSQVKAVIKDCALAGVKSVLIVTGGFADRGEAGLKRQNELVRFARSSGMRVVGPASLGVINTDPEVRLNASLAPELPPAGPLALFSQSAAVGVSMYASAIKRDTGISAFFSAGNRADVSGNDVMQYLEDDPRTQVVGLFLESFGNPRKFSRIARRLSRSKPVIVAKPGLLGLRLPAGHAVRATQAPAAAVDSMLRQSGVIRVETLDELMDVAQLLCGQPLPQGPGVAVLSNTQALAGIAASLLEEYGLHLVHSNGGMELGGSRSRALRNLAEALTAALEDEAVHAVVVSLIPSPMLTLSQVEDELAVLAAETSKPVLAILTGNLTPNTQTRLHGTAERRLPCFESPGPALAALAAVTKYSRWRDGETIPEAEAEVANNHAGPERAGQLLKDWLGGTTATTLTALNSEQISQLLACYNISVLPSREFTDPEAAVAAAEELGWPVALKSTDPALRHRLDLGGVRLNIHDAASLRGNIAQMLQDLRPYGSTGMEVQSMAGTGQAVVLRAVEDPLLGPVIAYGLSGDAVKLLDDWAYRVPPITQAQARDFVDAPAASVKLRGYEGLPALDSQALAELLLVFSRIKDDHPAIARIEFSPVLVGQRGVSVLAAEVHIANAARRTDSARRALRD